MWSQPCRESQPQQDCQSLKNSSKVLPSPLEYNIWGHSQLLGNKV